MTYTLFPCLIRLPWRMVSSIHSVPMHFFQTVVANFGFDNSLAFLYVGEGPKHSNSVVNDHEPCTISESHVDLLISCRIGRISS